MIISKIALLLVFSALFAINPAFSAGIVTVYDFGASWCAPCRADIARDNALNATYGGKVKFVFVIEDVPADQDKADAFIRSTRPNFEVRRDPSHSFARAMGANDSTPSAVIVGSNGEQEVIKGSISQEELKSRIDAHLGTFKGE